MVEQPHLHFWNTQHFTSLKLDNPLFWQLTQGYLKWFCSWRRRKKPGRLKGTFPEANGTFLGFFFLKMICVPSKSFFSSHLGEKKIKAVQLPFGKAPGRPSWLGWLRLSTDKLSQNKILYYQYCSKMSEVQNSTSKAQPPRNKYCTQKKGLITFVDIPKEK